MKLNLIVIKTQSLEILKGQYEVLGLEFDYHKHGKGPYHYSAYLNDLVFEIYPLPQSADEADSTLRLGFEIKDLDEKMSQLKNENWIIKTSPKRTEWGYIAVIQDFDGRKIELKEK